MRARIYIIMIYFSAFLLMPGTGKAQKGSELYNQYCVACHTIGGGNLIGPDLKGINGKRDKTWLINFIQSSQTMIKNGDPQAVQVFEKYNKIPMPDQPLSRSEVEKVLDYISTQSSPDQSIETTPLANSPEKKMAFNYTSAEANTGLALFKGKKGLSNGGVSCIACHTLRHDALIAGGTMARNLTPSYNNLGVQGIQAIMINPPFLP
ncbi:MAG: cytochrome c [Bacteroidota bacterium]|nr:cytochrome c [Bacteroidota bacterium]